MTEISCSSYHTVLKMIDDTGIYDIYNIFNYMVQLIAGQL